MAKSHAESLELFSAAHAHILTIDAAHREIVAQQSLFDGAERGLAEGHTRFLTRCAPAFADGTIAAQFAEPQKYYEFVARVGRDPRSDPREEHHTSRETAAVLQRLHQPGETVAAYIEDTQVRRKRWSIGRMATVPVVNLAPGRRHESVPQLAVVARLLAATGSEVPLLITIGDMAGQFNTEIYRGTDASVILVGHQALLGEAKSYYPTGSENTSVERYSQRERGFITALGLSGLKLKDLGYPANKADAWRSRLLNSLRGVIRGNIGYHMQVPRLAPLFDTNREAAAAVRQTLDQHGSDRSIEYDLALLEANLESSSSGYLAAGTKN